MVLLTQLPSLAVNTNQGRGQAPSTLQTSNLSQGLSSRTIMAARPSSSAVAGKVRLQLW